MADTLTKSERSQVMAAIRSKGNQTTEMRLMSILREFRITGWRRHQRVVGRPDFVFRRERLAVFVDGCFWHGCAMHGRIPKTRTGFWAAKITRNRERDAAVGRLLKRSGWKILRLWEHELDNGAKAALKLLRALKPARKKRFPA